MIKENVGFVTELEKEAILALYQRKLALVELTNNPLLLENEHIYEKVICDLSKTMDSFNTWWSKTAQKYNWKSEKNGKWGIDFETNEIYTFLDD